MRIRIVKYSASSVCELHTELEDGRAFVLKPGMSYRVGDNETPHRSRTDVGARLFIVD